MYLVSATQLLTCGEDGRGLTSSCHDKYEGLEKLFGESGAPEVWKNVGRNMFLVRNVCAMGVIWMEPMRRIEAAEYSETTEGGEEGFEACSLRGPRGASEKRDEFDVSTCFSRTGLPKLFPEFSTNFWRPK